MLELGYRAKHRAMSTELVRLDEAKSDSESFVVYVKDKKTDPWVEDFRWTAPIEQASPYDMLMALRRIDPQSYYSIGRVKEEVYG